MCFALAAAIPLASLALSAGSAVMGFASQSAQADAQARAWEANYTRALAADRDAQGAITQRQIQEAGATGQLLHAQDLDEARRQAAAVTQGEKMGIGGGTNLQNLVADIGSRIDANRVTLMTNWNMKASQLQAEKDAQNATAESRINGTPAGTPPNPIAPVLQVAGAGARYFGDQERLNRPVEGL